MPPTKEITPIEETPIKELIRKDIYFKATEVDEENFIIRGVFSTPQKDRHGEIINQTGWKLEEYKQNPVILFAHDQWTPAVGKAIDLAVDQKGNLSGGIQFAAKEFELAETLFNLYKEGYMRAFSVGFVNDLCEKDEANDTLILRENTLYEISCVNVPANSMALASQKGIDINSLKKAISDLNKAKLEDKILNKEVELSEMTIEKIGLSISKKLKNIRTDIAGQRPVKAVTPAGKGGARKFASIKQINSAIRSLLKQKYKIKSNLKV